MSAQAAAKEIVLVTGMSGAGRSTTLKILEDLGFEAVDNLPLSLLPNLVPADRPPAAPCAIGVDIRARDFGVESLLAQLARLRGYDGARVMLLFLDCDDTVLQRRFTETRRPHPLSTDRPLPDVIGHERGLLAPLRAAADLILDTSRLRAADLKRLLGERFGSVDAGMRVFVKSFSYRQGLPNEADLVFDVRFLRNPHYEPELQPLTGRDRRVGAYVAADPVFAETFDRLTGLIEPLLPRFAQEGKSYLTIAIGCTGGRHRSVYVAERLAGWLRGRGHDVHLSHRDAPVEGRDQGD